MSLDIAILTPYWHKVFQLSIVSTDFAIIFFSSDESAAADNDKSVGEMKYSIYCIAQLTSSITPSIINLVSCADLGS